MNKLVCGFLTLVMCIILGGCSQASGSSAGMPGTPGAPGANTVTLNMVLVPAGSFQRDGTASNTSTISAAFRISDKEITRAQFLAIMGGDPSDTTHSSGMTDPVQNVSWYQAIAFCNKLSLAKGLTQVYTVTGIDFSTLSYANIPTSDTAIWNAATANWNASGYRLPTEMEWEWAAMGATSDSTATWSNNVDTTGYTKAFAGSPGGSWITVQTQSLNYQWNNNNSNNTTHPVGKKLSNELGLYDMSGNVSEWCWDVWVSYPDGTLSDYHGKNASSADRVDRGSAAYDSSGSADVAARSDGGAYEQYNFAGFRVVHL